MIMDDTRVDLTWVMEGVESGLDDSLYNPLARGVYSLFGEKGRPFERLSKCFFRDSKGETRWFGVFIYSAGDRVLFFPGFSKSQENPVGYKDKELWCKEDMEIDHLSLDRDRETWHITAPKSQKHIGNFFTQKVSNDVRHWFSMSTFNSECLRTALSETLVSMPVPQSDVERRIKTFIESRDGVTFQLLSFNSEHSFPDKPWFLHFSVFFGAPGFQVPDTTILGIPDIEPFSNNCETNLSETPI